MSMLHFEDKFKTFLSFCSRYHSWPKNIMALVTYVNDIKMTNLQLLTKYTLRTLCKLNAQLVFHYKEAHTVAPHRKILLIKGASRLTFPCVSLFLFLLQIKFNAFSFFTAVEMFTV